MINVHYFAFGPFQENTYVLWDETKECIILDPGNSNTSENKKLSHFIEEKQLTVKRLILTHAHVDHISGNRYIFDTYGLLPEVHKDDVYFIEKQLPTANMYGIPAEQSPMPVSFINEGDVIKFGNSELNTLHTPGHSTGSISYYSLEDKFIIGGDVMFYGSIGRTDLPLGHHDTLIKSIKEKLFPLGDDMKVYSGHGMPTTIGFERMNNPFLV